MNGIHFKTQRDLIQHILKVDLFVSEHMIEEILYIPNISGYKVRATDWNVKYFLYICCGVAQKPETLIKF